MKLIFAEQIVKDTKPLFQLEFGDLVPYPRIGEHVFNKIGKKDCLFKIVHAIHNFDNNQIMYIVVEKESVG